MAEWFCCCLVDKCAQLFARPWAVAQQLPLFREISQTRILERVALSFSRGSSPPRDHAFVSCIGGQILHR